MKLLFATDGAKQSTAAIEMLKHFALEDGDTIKVITVIDMALPLDIDMFGGFAPDTSQIENAARGNAARILEETALVLRGFYGDRSIEITTETLFGSPDSRIVETAEEDRPDLIIIGSHGHSRWERLLIGSVSNSVVQHAPCSVLVVRTPGD